MIISGSTRRCTALCSISYGTTAAADARCERAAAAGAIDALVTAVSEGKVIHAANPIHLAPVQLPCKPHPYLTSTPPQVVVRTDVLYLLPPRG